MMCLSSNHRAKPGEPVAQLSPLLVCLKQQCEKGYKEGSCIPLVENNVSKIQKDIKNLKS